MKLNVLFSVSLHIILCGLFFVSRPGTRKFEGYPTVIPVQLMQLKPVAYKAPEVQRVKPRVEKPKPKPKALEGVTIEKKRIEPEEQVEEVPKFEKTTSLEKPEKPDEGNPVASEESVRLDVEEFPFSYYLALLQSRIQSNWEPPYQSSRAGASKKAIVYFKIQRSGRITDIAIETRSGDYLFDQAAVRAVTLANPLPPLPYDFPQTSLGVHFEFEQGI